MWETLNQADGVMALIFGFGALLCALGFMAGRQR